MGQGAAQASNGIDVRSGGEEQFHHGKVAAIGRPHQGGASAAENEARLVGGGLGVDGRPVLEQQPSGLQVAAGRGRHEGRGAKIVGGGGGGSTGEQQLHHAM